MDMHGCRAVGFLDVFIINFIEPVVGGIRAGVGQNQAAQGNRYGGIFFDAPVFDRADVVLNQFLDIGVGVPVITGAFVLLPIQNIGFGSLGKFHGHQRLFDDVLDFFHCGQDIGFLAMSCEQCTLCEGCGSGRHQSHLIVRDFFRGNQSFHDCRLNSVEFVGHNITVPFLNGNVQLEHRTGFLLRQKFNAMGLP